MATNRQRRTRKLDKIPDWVGKMLETGQPPARDAPGYDQYMGWQFFDEIVKGLTDDQNFKNKMMMEARNAQQSDS